MTAISDRARALAIQIEAKKDRMSQRQSGEWAITFVLHPQEMPPELMNAKPGTRYTIALVETGDNGEPVERPNTSKERKVTPNSNGSVHSEHRSDNRNDTPPRSDKHPKPVGAEKTQRLWKELPPAQQAGILCGEPAFWTFLNEKYDYMLPEVRDATKAAVIVREICGVDSRRDIATDHRARVLFHSLNEQYRQWKLEPEVVG